MKCAQEVAWDGACPVFPKPCGSLLTVFLHTHPAGRPLNRCLPRSRGGGGWELVPVPPYTSCGVPAGPLPAPLPYLHTVNCSALAHFRQSNDKGCLNGCHSLSTQSSFIYSFTNIYWAFTLWTRDTVVWRQKQHFQERGRKALNTKPQKLSFIKCVCVQYYGGETLGILPLFIQHVFMECYHSTMSTGS